MILKELLACIPFEIERSVCAKLNKAFHRFPTSKPFVSGDTFRSMADVVFDANSNPKASDIKGNSIVFVFIDLLPVFAEKILPEVKNRFILITHKGDINITKDYAYIADNPKIIHWFAQNCDFEHPKITPIPIGLENQALHNVGNTADYKKLQKNKGNHIPKVVIALNLSTNPDKRYPCYRAFWKNPNAVFINNITTSRIYRKTIKSYMFIASPEGNGIDCHRTWEAIYLGLIPIVNDNYLNRFFASLDLPIILTNDWNEFAEKTEDELADIYKHTMAKTNTKAAYYDYWEKLIFKYKH
ncbi:MAG: hypothetical protein J6T84_01610 [Spirochaetaceae bacterium]|nr:hypothetical protein [Spirochaetaceae bacterium]